MAGQIRTVMGHSRSWKAWKLCQATVEDVILTFHHLVISSLNWPGKFQFI